MSRQVFILRILTVFGLFAGGFVLLAMHLYRMQIARHAELSQKAMAKYTASKTHTGRRGNICDVNGNLLVGDIACRDVLADLNRIKPERRNHVIDTLASALDLDRAVLRQRFASGLSEVVIDNQVPLATANRLAELKLPGIRFVDSANRHYPKGRLLANVLGFTQRTSIEGRALNRGVYGVELVCDRELAPRFGRTVYQRDRKGQALHREPPKAPESLDGKNVYLTIHEPLQHIAESELARLCEEFAPRYAYAVMADPKTGAILALAQSPNFDPNERRDEERPFWTSRFLVDVYEPGSTMKGIAVAAAIDYGVCNLNTRYDCEKGMWFFAGRMLRDTHSYARLTVAEIIMHSSNIGTAKIAIDMGEPRLYQALRRFGFGEATGIELPGEANGIFRPLEKWDSLSISRFPIGQGLAVTPLQMVQGYAALANGGILMQPYLIDRIEDPETGQIVRNAPIVKHRAVRESTAREITKALQLVTTREGTAPRAAVANYRVAGKTGTSQKFLEGTYNSGKYTASFIGYVPAEDPAFVLLVVADEPTKRSYYGGTVCGPTFSRIAEQSLRYLDIAPVTPGGDTPRAAMAASRR